MMPYRRRSASGGLTAAIILIGLFLSFVIGGGFNPIVFFIFLAIAIFVGSLGTLNPGRIYGSLIGAMWMIILALFFATHIWQLFLLGAILSALMGSLARPIIASLLGLSLFNTLNNQQQQQPPYYQPPQQSSTPPSNQPYYQPSQQPYQSYEQGYQAPPPPPGTYQEGGQQYPYSTSSAQDYEQPQAQYPQQMPPQQ